MQSSLQCKLLPSAYDRPWHATWLPTY